MRTLIMAICFTFAIACFIAASITNMMMIAAINKMKPQQEQISLLGSYMAKQLRISREYRQFYPTGKLELAGWIITGVGVVCFLIAGRLFGFPI